MTMLEKIGVVVIVAAVLITVAVLTWQLLRPSKVPPRPERIVDMKTLAEMQGEINDRHSQALFYAHMLDLPRFEIERVSYEPLPAFRFPAREPLEDVDGPVRSAFRRFLEGGPDYYHQGV